MNAFICSSIMTILSGIKLTTVAARSKAWALTAPILWLWALIPLNTRMYVRDPLLLCPVQVEALWWTDVPPPLPHGSKSLGKCLKNSNFRLNSELENSAWPNAQSAIRIRRKKSNVLRPTLSTRKKFCAWGCVKLCKFQEIFVFPRSGVCNSAPSLRFR